MSTETDTGITKSPIPLELNIPIGVVIKTWREYRGWGVTEFANKTQVSKGYISALEHNRIEQPTNERLAKLATILEIDVWDILARRMPDDKETQSEQKPDQATSRLANGKKAIRFGSGFPIVSGNRTRILRDILRQLEETTQMVEKLLSLEETTE